MTEIVIKNENTSRQRKIGDLSIGDFFRFIEQLPESMNIVCNKISNGTDIYFINLNSDTCARWNKCSQNRMVEEIPEVTITRSE